MLSMSRRDFVRMGAAAAAAGAGAVRLSAAGLKSPIGLQLYCVRALLPKDFDGTLVKLAAMGYKSVEAAGYYNKTATEWRKSMDAAGLRCVSTHHPLGALLGHENELIDYAHTVGMDFMICSSTGKKDPHAKGPMTLDDWKWASDEFNRIGALVKAAGMRFGYHNHTHEFDSENGVVFYDELLRSTDPKLVVMEMDCGWVVAAGRDPVEYLSKTPERFPLLHVKEVAKNAKGQWSSTVLGSGPADYHRILRAAKGLKQYFVEQEEYDGDIMDAMRMDADYMKSFRL